MPRYNKVNKITNQCSFQLKFDDNTGSNFKIANKRNKIKKFSNRAIHLLSYNKLHVPWLFSSVLDKFFLQLLTPWSCTNHFLQGICVLIRTPSRWLIMDTFRLFNWYFSSIQYDTGSWKLAPKILRNELFNDLLDLTKIEIFKFKIEKIDPSMEHL